jgi:hypothetical protein
VKIKSAVQPQKSGLMHGSLSQSKEPPQSPLGVAADLFFKQFGGAENRRLGQNDEWTNED